MNKTVLKIKKAGRSPMYLVSTVMLTASVVFLVLISLINFNPGLLAEEAARLGMPESLAKYMRYISYVPLFLLAEAALVLLTAIGMWMHFAESFSKKSTSCKGMTFIKAVLVIRLIVSVAVCGVCAVSFIGLSVTRIVGDAPLNVVSVLSYAASVAVILWMIITVAYYRGVFVTMRSVRMTICTGIIMGRISMFVVVMNILLAVAFTAAGIFSGNIYIILYSISYALSYFFCALSLISLRSEMHYIASKGSAAIE